VLFRIEIDNKSAVWLDTSEYEHFAVSTAGRIVKKDASSWSSSPPPGKETFRKIHEQESVSEILCKNQPKCFIFCGTLSLRRYTVVFSGFESLKCTLED
jgi:hypothetical protein